MFKHNPFRDKGLQLVVFVLGILLFSWPLMGIAREVSFRVFFTYLFLAWIFVILLLFLIGKSVGSSSAPKRHDPDNTGTDNV